VRRIALLPVLLATFLGAPPAHAWTWPVDGPVLRPFLFGNDPYAAGLHRGIDIGAAPGTPVRTPRAGLVRFAGSVPGNGRTVTIETADGYSVTLLHLGAFSVARGATVAEGDPVAVVGPSDGIEHELPSVHLGVRVTADAQGYVDPLPLLPLVAPSVPEASEPEPPAEPEPSVPETPSEAPEASEPEPPVEEAPVGQPHLPLQVPAASVPHPVHAPAVEAAAEPPTVTPVRDAAAPPTVRSRSTPMAKSMVPAAPATAGREREKVARSESAAPPRASTSTQSVSVPVEPPPPVPATRTEPESAGLRLPAITLAAVLLLALTGMRRRLVRRRSSPRVYPGRSVPRARVARTEAPQPAIESARPQGLTETPLRKKPPGRSRLRPSPDRSGPRPDRGRAPARRRSTRQPVSAGLGTRRSR
jgi:peptidase M23-like protein